MCVDDFTLAIRYEAIGDIYIALSPPLMGGWPIKKLKKETV